MVYVICSAVFIVICLGFVFWTNLFSTNGEGPTDEGGCLNLIVGLFLGCFLAVIVILFAAAVIFFVTGCIKYAIELINP